MNKTYTKRVLQVVSATKRGGAETLVMDIYRKINREKVQFDFVTHSNEIGDFDKEIEQLGGNVYRIKSIGQVGVKRYLNQLIKIMYRQPYTAVHSHTDYQGGFVTLAAKMAGIKNRIIHSHSTDWDYKKSIRYTFTLYILKKLMKYTATNYCACSNEAASFLFDKNMLKKTVILKNGIEVNKFIDFSTENKVEILRNLDIPSSAKVIGHVGRFSESKNHIFLLEILKDLITQDRHYYGIFVGDGHLKNKIEHIAKKMGILQNLRFTGIRADIPLLMNAFDVFVFPSIYEGFGIVTLEAQCSGIPCVLSDTIPITTDMKLGLVTYVSLNKTSSDWANEIKHALKIPKPDKEERVKYITDSGYNIITSISKWEDLY